jgi:hypothetical protein
VLTKDKVTITSAKDLTIEAAGKLELVAGSVNFAQKTG